LLVGFVSGGLGIGAILASGSPVSSRSVAVQVAPGVALCMSGELMTLGHLLVPLRC
jgi:hypothetical protein